MKIYRNGCEFELTFEELRQSATEYSAIMSRKKKAQKEQEEKDIQSWQQFSRTEGKKLPYPENLLIEHMLGDQSGMEYINGTAEHKADILAGMTWALESLPKSMRMVMECLYRDHMTIKECAQANNLSVTVATRLRNNGHSRLRKPVRYAAVQCGMKKYAESLPAFGAAGEPLRNKIRSETIIAEGFGFYGFRYVGVRHLGLTLETITMLLRNDISNTTGLQEYLKEHSMSDLIGITPAMEADIADALAFIDKHSFTILNK